MAKITREQIESIARKCVTAVAPEAIHDPLVHSLTEFSETLAALPRVKAIAFLDSGESNQRTKVLAIRVFLSFKGSREPFEAISDAYRGMIDVIAASMRTGLGFVDSDELKTPDDELRALYKQSEFAPAAPPHRHLLAFPHFTRDGDGISISDHLSPH